MQTGTAEASQPWSVRFRNIRVLRVIRVADVTPLMRRVTLGGDEIEGIPDGPNVKLLIPPAGLSKPEWPLEDAAGKPIWPAEDRRPVVRTYTVRRHDRAAGELDVDFVLHEHGGPACNWARRATIGSEIGMGGPGGRTVEAADFYLLAADHSALPAVSRILEGLPRSTKGCAFIEVPDAEERQPIDAPPDVTINWLYRDGTPAGQSTLLQDAIHRMPWPSGDPFVWIGAESGTTRDIRAYIKSERGMERRRFLAIGYWKRGLSEADYHDQHDHDRGPDYHDVVREQFEKLRQGRHG